MKRRDTRRRYSQNIPTISTNIRTISAVLEGSVVAEDCGRVDGKYVRSMHDLRDRVLI